MLTIDAQLKNGDLSRFQLLYGEEAYLVRNYKNKLKQALSVPGDDMMPRILREKNFLWKKCSQSAIHFRFFKTNV